MPLDIECMVKLSCVLTYHQAFSHVFDTFIAWPKFICPATKRACASRSSGSSRSFGSRRSSECRWSIHFVTRPCQTFFLTPSFVSVAKTGFQNGQMLRYFYISICLSWSLWTSLLLYWALPKLVFKMAKCFNTFTYQYVSHEVFGHRYCCTEHCYTFLWREKNNKRSQISKHVPISWQSLLTADKKRNSNRITSLNAATCNVLRLFYEASIYAAAMALPNKTQHKVPTFSQTNNHEYRLSGQRVKAPGAFRSTGQTRNRLIESDFSFSFKFSN